MAKIHYADRQELGSHFGAHSGMSHFTTPALANGIVHAGLWESATETAHSLMARIAIIHLVAEARGIDMNPLTMAKLQSAGDKESTRVLTIIHADEITRMPLHELKDNDTDLQMSQLAIDGSHGYVRNRVLTQ